MTSLVHFSTSLKSETSTIFELKLGLLRTSIAFCVIFKSVSQIITLAPELKNLFAMSSPNPCAPPVTIAVLFLKSKSIFLI